MTLSAIFFGGGSVVFVLGWRLRRAFRREQKPGFRDFGVGPQGLLEYLGLALMLCGAISVGLALCLPLILR